MMKILLCSLVLVIASMHPLLADALLSPTKPFELVGTHGKFDFIKIDQSRGRLLACHTGNGSLDVIDVASSKLIKSVPTGAAQGVAIDDKGARYFVSASKPPKLVIIDAEKLEVTGEVPLPNPADLVVFDPASKRVLVDNDVKPETWIINPESKQIVQTNTFPGGGMEDFAFDPFGTSILQNLKDSSQLAKSDWREGKVIGLWSTSPAEKPHGLALVQDMGAVLVAGGTGKLVLMNLEEGQEGKVLASADIAPRVDEIAYDPGLKRAYCASGTGVISIVDVDKTSLIARGTIPSAPGAHSIAVDATTHTVWIVFAKGEKAYVQAFTAKSP
jgi:DNA-binding beta-propeller fold protein YncE